MKTQENCYMCEGTKLRDKEEGFVNLWGNWVKKIIKEKCGYCWNKGVVDVYTCKRCGHKQYIMGTLSYSFYNGECENCYADIETGKYLDDFFYIQKNSLKKLSDLVNELMKEGYMPLGRAVSMGYSWMMQAIIKKEKGSLLKGAQPNKVKK